MADDPLSTEEEPERPPGRRGGIPRPLLIAGGVLLVIILALVGVAIWAPSARSTAGGAVQAPATATITRGTLTELVTAPGKLAYGPEQLAESRLAGTVTGLPAIGSTVDRGKTLFRIDDQPVLLFLGTLPAYRELTAGHAATDPGSGSATGGTGTGTGAGTGGAAVPASKGADVRQFEQNLAALGYTGLTVDDNYTEQTAAVVRRWQKDLGLPPTGSVELGRIFYATGPVRIATHKLTLGVVASGPVLSYTGTARLVTASVKQSNQQIAKVQTKVTVVLPNGKEVPGTVQSVATPTDPGANSLGGQEPTLDVVVALDDQNSVTGLDDGTAQVRFVSQQRENVLMVPVGALLALAEGGYGLQLIEGSTSHVVAVTTGLFANGNVEVSGPDLKVGQVVGMAR